MKRKCQMPGGGGGGGGEERNDTELTDWAKINFIIWQGSLKGNLNH